MPSDAHVQDGLRALVVAGSPAPSSPALTRRLAQDAGLVVAVDRGLDHCRAAGVVPQLFCGDADTVSARALAEVRADGLPCDLHSPQKDETDLELALRLVEERAHEQGVSALVTLTCASGGAPDHALAVFGVLARHAARRDVRLLMLEDAFACAILAPGERWFLPEDALGCRFSAIALAGPARAELAGLAWSGEVDFGPLSDLGVSNRVAELPASVRVREGILATFLFQPQLGRAAGPLVLQ